MDYTPHSLHMGLNITYTLQTPQIHTYSNKIFALLLLQPQLESSSHSGLVLLATVALDQFLDSPDFPAWESIHILSLCVICFKSQIISGLPGQTTEVAALYSLHHFLSQ